MLLATSLDTSAFTIAGLNPWVVLGCIAVVFVGASLQAAIGIGLGLVSAPILGLVDPAFVPAALIVAMFPLTMGMAWRERGDIDRTGLGWGFVGRIPGVVGGALIAATGNRDAIALVIGVSVLIAVGASLTSARFRPTRPNLLVAGAASGFGAAIAGIGGPPMAITYQHANPSIMRSTLSAFFVLGGLTTMVAHLWVGVLGTREALLGVLLFPGAILGLATAPYTTKRLPPAGVRATALAVCTISALALIGKELLA